MYTFFVKCTNIVVFIIFHICLMPEAERNLREAKMCLLWLTDVSRDLSVKQVTKT